MNASPRRYAVIIEVYSLAPGRVGEPIYNGGGIESRHRSLRAAGRMLGSLISGKRQKRELPGTGLRMYVADLSTGRTYCRNDCPR